MIRALAGVVALLASLLLPATSTRADSAPLRILAVGDSITLGDGSASGSYRGELGRLLDQADVPHEFSVAAVAGSRCTYWPSRINALLDQYRPDVVLVACGTNDDTGTAAARDSMATALRQTWEAVKARGLRLGVALVQYSDVTLVPSWLEPSEARANDVIWSQMSLHYLPVPGWISGVANFQQIPGTPEYVDSGGIHPTPLGYRVMGRIWYDALRSDTGWPAALDPPLCGMAGHRAGYPRLGFTPCLS